MGECSLCRTRSNALNATHHCSDCVLLFQCAAYGSDEAQRKIEDYQDARKHEFDVALDRALADLKEQG